MLKSHCKNGHAFEGENFYVNSKGWRMCRVCRKNYENRYYSIKENKEKRLKSKRDYGRKDYELGGLRDKQLQKNYGISQEKRDELEKEQNNLCAICFKPQKSKGKKRLEVDHNHETKQIRGLLCSSCNTGLGKFSDSIDILESAIIYLKKYA